MNSFVITGRVVDVNDEEIIVDDTNHVYVNETGDTVPERYTVELWRGLVEQANELKDGDLIAVRGQIRNNHKGLHLIAEKIAFIGGQNA